MIEYALEMMGNCPYDCMVKDSDGNCERKNVIVGDVPDGCYWVWESEQPA